MSSSPKKPLSPSTAAAARPADNADNAVNPTSPDPSETSTATNLSQSSAADASQESSAASLELKRPVMRPVRPQPPATPPTPEEKPAQKVAEPIAPITPVTPIKATASIAATIPEVPEAPEVPDPALSRFQPIPPPSEPKQYRAIGLVRGRYTPSEEQFTRGEMAIADGAAVEAVLLGRVMSLVKNHLDLTQEHLWVVYPRTRNLQKDLHLQIVGVWDPEKLQKELIESDEADAASDTTSELTEASEAEASQPTEAAASPMPIAEAAAENLTPGYEDDYFSIRGEVIGAYPNEGDVVIRIQQSPRKSTDQAKAFKLHLKGMLPGEKAQGYFWELHVRRQHTALVITDGKVIGMVPPRKRSEQGDRPPRRGGGGKPFAKRFDGGSKPRGSTPPPNRPPLPKPLKRTEPSSDS